MIKIKTKEYSIEVVTSDKTLSSELIDSIGRLCDIVSRHNVPLLTGVADVIKPFPPQSSAIPEPERNHVRERLPNVDAKTLRVQIGKDITEVSIDDTKTKQRKEFRCPECGQSHIIVVEGLAVVRLFDEHEPILVSLLPGSQTTSKDMEYFRTRIADAGVAISDSKNIDGFCPHCSSFDTLSKWIKAWDAPLDFFEVENPCPMCGSEAVMTDTSFKDGGTNYKCENQECKKVFNVKEAY